ncbi:hypothetical protein [Rubripirellula reticaptiva]|uniref:Uncharacterized protein n=1 Tax=Rubripirellula reticaptiva TaxID=2528013 RepID=A0A5C6F3F7_9BACT|nr:hypothetical protein [Rubripirellula reticaptiva]TWU55040.1 hypothetical protein Poly59_13330 [Rubripirellula reticaptiva]
MLNVSSETRSFRRESQHEALVIVALVIAALSLGGCRICADCEDLAYPAYGGAWQRTNRESGRVGSVFDPGGAKLSELVNRDDPSQPDEIIRELQSQKKKAADEDDDPRDSGEANEPKSKEPNVDRLRDRKLEDIENEDEERLRNKSLDDIEVRIIPGRAPVMVTTE